MLNPVSQKFAETSCKDRLSGRVRANFRHASKEKRREANEKLHSMCASIQFHENMTLRWFRGRWGRRKVHFFCNMGKSHTDRQHTFRDIFGSLPIARLTSCLFELWLLILSPG